MLQLDDTFFVTADIVRYYQMLLVFLQLNFYSYFNILFAFKKFFSSFIASITGYGYPDYTYW